MSTRQTRFIPESLAPLFNELYTELTHGQLYDLAEMLSFDVPVATLICQRAAGRTAFSRPPTKAELLARLAPIPGTEWSERKRQLAEYVAAAADHYSSKQLTQVYERKTQEKVILEEIMTLMRAVDELPSPLLKIAVRGK